MKKAFLKFKAMEMYYDAGSAELFKGAHKLLESRTKKTNDKNEFE
jgi:hypothetical protein